MKTIQAPVLLLAVTATALRLPSHAMHRVGVQARDDDPGPYDGRDGPVAPNTVKNCDFYYTTEEPSETCDVIEKGSGISHKDFVTWNPSVKYDCSGINVGWAYCVHVDPTRSAPAPDPSKPTPPAAGDPSTTTAPSSSTSTPSPIQDGTVDNCQAWYKAKSGDTCDAITRKNGFTIQQFETWNPALGDDCSGLWANFYYCVAGPGWSPSTKPTPAKTSPRSPATDSPAPSPTQDGIIDSCNKWYKAKGGDNCNAISKKNGISSKEFKEWNPAVEDDCSGLWANYYYCVAIPGHTPVAPTQTPPKPSAPQPSGPPTQDGIVANCQTLYTAKKGDSCATIVKQYGNMDLATFIKWNPAVGEECYNLWASYGYCVGTKDKPATKPGSTGPPPSSSDPGSPSGCSNSHPEPTQPGALCECRKWYKVSRGDSCYNIARKFGVTEDDLSRWNPESNCQLWLNYNICVSA